MKRHLVNTILSGIFSGTTLVVFVYFLNRYIYLSTDLLMYTSLSNRFAMFCVCAVTFAVFLWNTINCAYNMVKLLSDD
jgi:hypothetical protein